MVETAEATEPGRLTRLWREHVTSVIRSADAASDAARVIDPAGANRRAFVALVVAAMALIANEFLTRDPAWVTEPLAALGMTEVSARLAAGFQNSQLTRLTFWGSVQVLTYVIPALLVIRYVFRGSIADFGLRVRGIGRHAWMYGALMTVSIPGVLYAATSPAFLAKYPFLDLVAGQALFPDMYLWWLVYAAQFVALEFFFRGFLVHGLKERLGFAAVFVMAVPYAMIHFQKPMLEAMMAIGGGVVLGTLSLGTRSIWWGAALHIAIAGTMDVLALNAKGYL